MTAPSLEFVGNKAANYQQGQYGQRDKLQQKVRTWASHFSLHLWSRQPIRHSALGADGPAGWVRVDLSQDH